MRGILVLGLIAAFLLVGVGTASAAPPPVGGDCVDLFGVLCSYRDCHQTCEDATCELWLGKCYLDVPVG